MRLVCVTQHWWDKYVEIHNHRETICPAPHRVGLFVAEGDELVAGVLIYDTTGPHLFFEHLVTNETATPRQRHKAVKMMAQEMISYTRTSCKVPHIIVRHKGIERILKAVGLVEYGAKAMTIPLEKLA